MVNKGEKSEGVHTSLYPSEKERIDKLGLGVNDVIRIGLRKVETERQLRADTKDLVRELASDTFDRRFSHKFDHIEERIDPLNKRIDDLENTVTCNLDDTLFNEKRHNSRFKKLEERIDQVAGVSNNEIEQLKNDVKKLSKSLKEKLSSHEKSFSLGSGFSRSNRSQVRTLLENVQSMSSKDDNFE